MKVVVFQDRALLVYNSPKETLANYFGGAFNVEFSPFEDSFITNYNGDKIHFTVYDVLNA